MRFILVSGKRSACSDEAGNASHISSATDRKVFTIDELILILGVLSDDFYKNSASEQTFFQLQNHTSFPVSLKNTLYSTACSFYCVSSHLLTH